MKDNGYILLCVDLEELLNEAKEYQFDDFQNTKYATPKVELHKKLMEIVNNNRDGKYDNE